MSKLISYLTAVIVVYTVIFVLDISAVRAGETAPAMILRDRGCSLHDSCGVVFVPADISRSVVSNDANGNIRLECTALGVNTDCITRGAVIRRNFLCGTFLGLTTESFSVVTPQGYSKLICIINPGEEAF